LIKKNQVKLRLSVLALALILFSNVWVTAACPQIENQALSVDNPVKEDVLSSEPAWASAYTDWEYRRKHQVSYTVDDRAGTGYQIKITVRFGPEPQGGSYGDVYVSGNCQDDFNDIRFADDDGTELSYWRESYTTSDNAVFWVKLKDSVTHTQYIHMYYGNTLVGTTSDGDATFIFFDDFESGFNRWTVHENNWKTTTSGAYSGSSAWGDADSSGRSLYWIPSSDIDYDIMIHSYVKIPKPADSRTEYVFHQYEADGHGCYGAASRYDDAAFYGGQWNYYSSDNSLTPNWQRWELALDFTYGLYKFYLDGSYKGSQPLVNSLGSSISEVHKVASVTTRYTTSDHYLDNFFIRKWTSSEPPHLVWYAEK